MNSWISWGIVLIPLLFIIAMSYYSRRYIRSVADYLVAGRVAGRYVISVADMTAGLSAFTLVAMCEVSYNTGFAMAFWNNILFPLGIFLSLTGFITYRFRETCALSGGQFLELRYSRKLRIFATVIRVFAEILTNCIGPAVAVRFLIYLLGLPLYFTVCGFRFSTFVVLLIGLLGLALFVILTGGRISLIVTDCLQGLLSYPIFVIFFVFVLTSFSWTGEVIPVMSDRGAGESFLNPYDVHNLRDFNMFSLFAAVIGSFFGRGLWLGNDTSGCGRTPHEQKMSGMLGQWRTGFSALFCLTLVIAVITVMNHANFTGKAHEVRVSLTHQAAQELPISSTLRSGITDSVRKLSPVKHKIGQDAPLTREKNLDTPYLNTVHNVLKEKSSAQKEGNFMFQNFRSLYNQMMLPVVMRHLLPPALTALLVLLIIMLVISTDDSRIFNSAAAIIQDLVIPFCKKPLTLTQHVRLLKFMTVVVTGIFFAGSLFMAQLDFLNLFMVIAISIWGAGAGCVVLFGLYSRRGTTAGAFTALILGGGLSAGGMLLQRNWASVVYPFLAEMGWAEGIGGFLETVSAPFNPWIVWSMDPVKFPINSVEIAFIAMLTANIGYWVVSLLTCREPFNLERLLHRGKYNLNPEKIEIKEKFTWKKLLDFLLSITPDYTRSDKVIAWSVMIYSIIYTFVISFVGVVLLNIFGLWEREWWTWYFLVNSLIIPAILAVITTVWFFIGGVADLRRLFKDLKLRKINELDNGMVEGNVSLADKAAFEEKDEQK